QYTGVAVDPADHGGARSGGCGIVGDAERHCLQALAGGRDGLDVGHAERGLDQHFEADALAALLGSLDLRHHHVEGVHVGGHPHFRDQHHVESRAGLHDVDDIAIHVVRVEAVDAYHHRLRAPIELVERLDDVPARL